MHKIITFLLGTLSTVAVAQQTTFEKSDGKATASYAQTIQYYEAMAASSPHVKIMTMGSTDSGNPLHIVVLDMSHDFDLEVSKKKGKTMVLINNGIHPGEPDGIEASKMLLRDIVADPAKQDFLKNTVLAVIPVYNIGGALIRNSHTRTNQVGPEAYGFRGNARNYDLNRDFIKADSRNTQGFYEIFHAVAPDIFIDTHVSNGADYQYVITHLATQHNKMGGALGEFIENEFIPALEQKMKAKGDEIIPYVNAFGATPDEAGFSQFMDGPRYSTGYTTLFHTIGFMVETHMLKPFEARVTATYNLLWVMIELADEQGTHIQSLRKQRAAFFRPGNKHMLSWALDRSAAKDIEFKGYEGQHLKSNVTGQSRLYYDREKPFTKIIPYYNRFIGKNEVTIPKAYIIPQAWYDIITLLKLNKVVMKPLERDTTVTVEVYHIDKYNTATSPYEGHYPHHRTTVKKTMEKMSFQKGDYYIPLDQFACRYLLETLEPEAPDSFFNWNFFDTILQQKEHFSAYVFEELALALLEADPQLKADFEAMKNTDEAFAQDGGAQLDYIYKRSPHYEKAHLRYPVYRVNQ